MLSHTVLVVTATYVFYSSHFETDTKLITSYTDKKLEGVYHLQLQETFMTKSLDFGQQIRACDSFANCQSTPSCNVSPN